MQPCLVTTIIKQNKEVIHLYVGLIRQQRYSESSVFKQSEASSGKVNLQYYDLQYVQFHATFALFSAKAARVPQISLF